MSVKNTVISQYRDKINHAALKAKDLDMPPEGWICTVRKALCMSAAQLSRRLGKSRALVSNREKAELSGSVTLKTMESMAEAMGCKFVYAILPEDNIDSILEIRARNKAQSLVKESSKHMALEQQALSKKQIIFEIEQLQVDMLKDISADFWND